MLKIQGRMKASRFSQEQIIAVLREHAAGAKTAEVWRRHGISDATFYIYGRLPRGKKVSGPGLAMIDCSAAPRIHPHLARQEEPALGALNIGQLS
jgi:putative transposase